MKHSISLIFFLFNFLFSYASAEICVIKAGASDYSPLTYSDAANNVVGMDVQLMEIIAKQAGCTVQWLPIMDWENVVKLLKTGEITIATSASDSPERREYAKMIPYRPDSIKLFVRNENLIQIAQIDSFENFINKTNYSIGIYTGYKYTSSFQSFYNTTKNKFRIRELPDDDISLQFKNLVARKVDSVIMETVVGVDLVKRLNLQNKVITLGFDLVGKGPQAFSNIMISKAADPNNYFYNLINNAVSIVKNDQTYNDIINSYLSLQ